MSRCDASGKEHAEPRTVTRSFGRGGSLMIIEKIPMISCPHCGQSYFTARTLHEIERLKVLRNSVALKRDVPIAVFSDVNR